MPLNLSGTLAFFQAFINPRIILPSITVKDLRQLDFFALRRAGYRGVVFDKDNCLTLPHDDKIVPELVDSWKECLDAFGSEHILIVSNTAGTPFDRGLIQAKSLSQQLRVPILEHRTFKPSYSCVSAVRSHFAHLNPDELVVVGDRILTDIVLANRLRQKFGGMENVKGPLAVWTTGVWQREKMLLRWVERRLVNLVENFVGRRRNYALRRRGIFGQARAMLGHSDTQPPFIHGTNRGGRAFTHYVTSSNDRVRTLAVHAKSIVRALNANPWVEDSSIRRYPHFELLWRPS